MRSAFPLFLVCLAAQLSPVGADHLTVPPPLKVLLFAGGGHHDYTKFVPFLTNKLSELANTTFDVIWEMEALNDAKLVEGYDVILYDLCWGDVAPGEILVPPLADGSHGKPIVVLYCQAHGSAPTRKLSGWEKCWRTGVTLQDWLGAFTIRKVTTDSPITKFLPDTWSTISEEVYTAPPLDSLSVPLLRAASPLVERDYIVCWTGRYGKTSVFATTLGHDMKTTTTPEYTRLVANGLLWTCGKLSPDGSPAPGYGVTSR